MEVASQPFLNPVTQRFLEQGAAKPQAWEQSWNLNGSPASQYQGKGLLGSGREMKPHLD